MFELTEFIRHALTVVQQFYFATVNNVTQELCLCLMYLLLQNHRKHKHFVPALGIS